MGAAFVPISGPVVADTVYCDNVLVARDVSFTLPEITPTTTDLQAMGTMSMPIWQLIENMETAITKVGVDMGLGKLVKPDMMPLEFRWAQTVTDANGTNKTVGCKAFIKGIPNKFAGIGIGVGETPESECTLMTTFYSLFVDGKEMVYVNRLAGICRIMGTDYAKGVSAFL